jgi:hypothetical protein
MCIITISERTGALVQRWQEFGHSEGQPFPVPRSSVISDVPGVASVVQNQFLHLRYDHNNPRRAGLIGAIIFELCAVFWQPALSLRHRRIQTRFAHKTRITYELRRNSSPMCYHCTSTDPLTDTSVCHPLRVSPTTSATFYLKVECLINTKTYRVGNYNYGICLVHVSALRGNTAFTVRYQLNRAEL